MHREKKFFSSPLSEAVEALERKWSFHIIYEIGNHKKIRFNQLQDELQHISPKILSDTLKKLEVNQLVEKKQFDKSSIKVEYTLSKDGLSLHPIIVDILKWSVSRKTSTAKNCPCPDKPADVP